MKSLKAAINESFVNESNDIINQILLATDDKQIQSLRFKLKRMFWDNDSIDKAIQKAKNELDEQDRKKSIELEKKLLTKKDKLAKAWTTAKYQKWLKSMIPDDTSALEDDFAIDMANNAQFETGLIEFIERKILRESNGWGSNESALERIRYDLEALM